MIKIKIMIMTKIMMMMMMMMMMMVMIMMTMTMVGVWWWWWWWRQLLPKPMWIEHLFKLCSRRFHSIRQTYVFYLSISKAWFCLLFKPLSWSPPFWPKSWNTVSHELVFTFVQFLHQFCEIVPDMKLWSKGNFFFSFLPGRSGMIKHPKTPQLLHH